MATKRIILLEKKDGEKPSYSFVLWAEVPALRQPQYANPEFLSAFRGVSPAELALLRSGALVEKAETISIDADLDADKKQDRPKTWKKIQKELEAAWQQFQQEISDRNPWDRYGSFWEGGGNWTNGGVN